MFVTISTHLTNLLIAYVSNLRHQSVTNIQENKVKLTNLNRF